MLLMRREEGYNPLPSQKLSRFFQFLLFHVRSKLLALFMLDIVIIGHDFCVIFLSGEERLYCPVCWYLKLKFDTPVLRKVYSRRWGNQIQARNNFLLFLKIARCNVIYCAALCDGLLLHESEE